MIKTEICQFKLKFGTICRIYEYAEFHGDFHFFCFWPEIPFLANLVKKIKTVSESWNLVPWPIRIWRIQWWCFFFCCRLETFFYFNFFSKTQNCWSWNLDSRLIWTCRIHCWFSFFRSEIPFFGYFGPKI